jgi:ATP-binding cassette subfamily B protein
MLSIIAIIGLRVMPIFEKAQKQLDLTNTIMRENILGTRVVKAFNIQQDQYNRYQKENTSLKKLLIHGQALMLPIMSIITFCVNAGVIVILTVAGAEFAKNGTAIDAGIFAFTQILIIVLMSAIMAVMVIVNSTRTIASVRRINQVFNINPSINEPVSPMLMSNDYSVEFKNVNFKYAGDAKTNVLCNINFDIPSGQTLGVVGGTGSGKSTVANLIPRLYDVTEGQILIGGIDIKNISLTELNEKVGIVLQEAMLMSGTIESNLKFGNHNATTEEMQAALADASAAKFVDELPEKLQSHVEQRGRNFSGGQKQRLSLARTLIKKPKVLILDDTTSALDLITEANVQANLLSNYKDTTTMIVSQRISSVRNANKIVVLNDGAVVGFGTHDELVKSNSTYRDIAISQLGQEVLN